MPDHAALHEPYAPLLRAALEAASPWGAAVAIDLCCGAGAKMPWLAGCCAPGALVVGIDLDRVTLGPADGRRVAADAHALPLRAGSADLIWCVAALGLLRDQALALRQAARALRPGGTLVVAVAGERWVRLRHGARRAGLTRPLPADGLGAELCEALEGAGLGATDLAAYLLDPPGRDPLVAALPLTELGDGADVGEPEPVGVLLVATGRAAG